MLPAADPRARIGAIESAPKAPTQACHLGQVRHGDVGPDVEIDRVESRTAGWPPGVDVRVDDRQSLRVDQICKRWPNQCNDVRLTFDDRHVLDIWFSQDRYQDQAKAKPGDQYSTCRSLHGFPVRLELHRRIAHDQLVANVPLRISSST